jgi:hypothetical protein
MKKLFILGLALVAACAAQAIPTLTGPTGGFEVSTADVASAKTVTVAVDEATNQDGIVWPNTRVLFGVCKGLEIGGMYAQDTTTTSTNANLWNVNAKYQLPINAGKVNFAIGGFDGQLNNAQFDGQSYHQVDGYLAVTCPLWGMKASGNIGYAKTIGMDAEGLTGGLALQKSLGDKEKAGLEFVFGDKAGVSGDFNPAGTDFANASHLNIYLTRDITDNLSARVAVADLGQDTSLCIGAAYKFGK